METKDPVARSRLSHCLRKNTWLIAAETKIRGLRPAPFGNRDEMIRGPTLLKECLKALFHSEPLTGLNRAFGRTPGRTFPFFPQEPLTAGGGSSLLLLKWYSSLSASIYRTACYIYDLTMCSITYFC